MARNIRITPYGGLGNRMFQYMFALALQARVPEAAISGARLPEWGIAQVPLPPKQAETRYVIRKHDVPFEKLVRRLREDAIIDVDVTRLNLRMEYYEDRLEDFRRVFPPGRAIGARSNEIAINIRGAEILTGVHRNFIPMPIAFYEEVIAETGLDPIFVGQIGNDAYGAALRARFPRARFVGNGSGLADFHFLRASHNIVPAISSYSWLAAWLSESAERIYLPVAGLYHPGARPDCDLLPRGDPRYTFFQSDMLEWTGAPGELDRLMHAPSAAFGFRRGTAPAWLGRMASPRRSARCWMLRRILALHLDRS